MSKKLMEGHWLWNRFYDDAIETYVGAKNEPVLDYRNLQQPRLRIMDGVTPGGTQLGDYGDDIAYVQTPQIVSPLNGAVDVNPTPMLTGSAFIGRVEGGAPDAHAASYWEIASDSQFANLIHTSGRVTDALTVYDLAAVPLTFEPETRFYARVRYESATGLLSAWSPVIDVTTRAAWTTYFDTTAIIGGVSTQWMTSYSTTVAAVYASTSHVTSWDAVNRTTSRATSHNTSGSNLTRVTTEWGTQYGSTSFVTSWSGSALTAKSTSHSTRKSRSTSSGSRTTSRSTTKSRSTDWVMSNHGTVYGQKYTSRMTVFAPGSEYENEHLTTWETDAIRITEYSGSRMTDYSASTSWTTSSSKTTYYNASTYYNTNKSTTKSQSKTTSRTTAINAGYQKLTEWATSFSGVTNYATNFSTQVAGPGSRTTTYDTMLQAASSHITDHQTVVALEQGTTTYPTSYQTTWEADVRTTSHVTSYSGLSTNTSHQTSARVQTHYNTDGTRNTAVSTDVLTSFTTNWRVSTGVTVFATRQTEYPDGSIVNTEYYYDNEPRYTDYSAVTENLTSKTAYINTAVQTSTSHSTDKEITTTYSTQVSAGGSHSTSYQTEYEAAGARSTSHDTTEIIDAQTTTYETSRTTN